MQPRTDLLAHNYFRLAGTELVAKLLTLAAFTYLARTLGPQRYGNLEFIVAVIAFFALMVEYGLGDYGARQVARQERPVGKVLGEVVTLRSLLAVGSFAACLLFALILWRGEVSWLLAAYGGSLLAYPLLLQWLFQGHDRMGRVALVNLTRYSVFAVLVFLLVRQDTPLPVIGLAACAAVGAAAFVGVAMARRLLRPVRWKTGAGDIRRAFRESTPIGLSEFLWAFLWFFPTLLLGILQNNESVGWYGVSHRITLALHSFVWLYFFNLMPSIARCLRERQVLADLLGSSMQLAVWAGTFVALVVTLLANDLLGLLFGTGYEPGSKLLALLIWMIPLSLISGHYRYALIAHNQQRLLLVSFAITAAAVILLSAVLAPVYGATGAAMTLLAGCILNLVLVFRYTAAALVRVGFWKPVAGPAVALGVAILCGRLLPPGHHLWSVTTSSLAFLAVLVLWDGRRIWRLGLLLAGNPRSGSIQDSVI